MKGTTSKTGRVSSGSVNTQRRRDLHSITKYWDKEVAVWRSAAVFFWFSIFLWISSVFWNLLFSPDLNSLSSESESPFFVFSFFQFLILVAQLLVISVKREEPNTKTLQSLLSKIILFIGLFLSILSLTNIANSILSNQGSDAHYYGTNTLYLDESILFLYFFAILHSIYLTYNFWKREQFVLAFPPIQQGRWFRLKARIPIVAKETIFFGSIAVFIYFLVFLVSKFFIINAIVELYSHFSGQTYHIVQTQSIPYFPLLMTLITSSSFTYFCFQISYHLLNIIFTQVKKFEQNLLISGLNCKTRPIIQYNCFLDLYYLSQYSYQRRANIYSCNTPKKSGDWVEVLQACRSVIDTLTTRLHEIVIHKAELKRKKTNLFSSIWPFSSTSIWLSKPPGFGRSQLIFSDLQLVIWAIEALSNLIQHSKEEDKSGNVQNTRSIEAALNSLVGCYIATKHYLETDERNPPKMLEESQLISPFTNTLAPTIISSIYRITTTFYRDFGTLSFPEEYSDTLQEFLDFQI